MCSHKWDYEHHFDGLVSECTVKAVLVGLRIEGLIWKVENDGGHSCTVWVRFSTVHPEAEAKWNVASGDLDRLVDEQTKEYAKTATSD